ncbi:MAG TPA: CHAT domain-containing protein, partial [Polyangium sp.]|nr:CHAT domain-containing protein [Polyangium sp.]
SRHFDALRASEEGPAVVSTLPNAKLFSHAQAKEATLKSLHGPSILHISTHGFFDKNVSSLHDPPHRNMNVNAPLPAENALVRAGLAFAGANQGVVGGEDGILTALEAAQLDLWGTKLVVLSACETGMGQAENGDGVYGLRRAFTIAGAETVVMSLWQVDAAATTDLLTQYYAGLSSGGGRAEALRQAQLAMLSSRDRSHPHYWASFIASGNDKAMDGRVVDPSFGRVNPSARGCTCDMGAHSDADDRWSFGAIVGAWIAATWRRRRCGCLDANRWSMHMRSFQFELPNGLSQASEVAHIQPRQVIVE